MSATEAGAAAIGDLLAAERELRAMTEQALRELRAALQMAAYTFAGRQYEAVVRRDPTALSHWTGEEWMAFFQSVAPITRGWADPGVLGERLQQVTGERDAALVQVRQLQEELALRAELAATGIAPAAPATPAPPAAGTSRDQRRPASGGARIAVGGGAFHWPQVTSQQARELVATHLVHRARSTSSRLKRKRNYQDTS